MVEQKEKVIVGMSGGVDSSVAAALLLKAGFDVVGVFMKFWSEPALNSEKLTRPENRCCNQDAEGRARKAAAKLGMLFYVVNVEQEFKKAVVDYFLKEYESGLTPNPCVVCNKEIKFRVLFNKAIELGADYVATGHYGKIKKIKGLYDLVHPKDTQKDQSYFLWQLGQKELSRILFPIGDYTKPEVRQLAKNFGLPSALTPDSQEVCFVLTDLERFFKKYIKIQLGKIIDAKGNILGVHEGLPLYTIGQRKGIKLDEGPYYVVAKDPKKNILIVTKNEKDLQKKEIRLAKINWCSGREPKLPLKVSAQIRYRQKLCPATFHKLNHQDYRLIFSKPQKSACPGQSAVFYRDNALLGGGVIV